MENTFHPSTFLDAEVSVFKNFKTSKSCRITTFRDWLFNEDEKLRELVDEIRAESDENRKKELKSNLWCITGSGVFENGRSSNNLVSHNGYIIIDIDYKDNKHLGRGYYGLIENVFSKIDVVCYAGKSVSGNGYFLIIGIEYPDKHKLYFRYIERWFKDYNITIDKNCSDVTRLRIYSYSDSYYINENATVLNKYVKEVKHIVGQVSATKYVSSSTFTIEELVRIVESSGVSITESYDEYFKVGAALYKEYGEAGRDYYHRICRIDTQYDEHHCNKQFDEIVDRGYSDVTKGTIIYYMQQKNLI